MPSTTIPYAARHVPPPRTTENLDYANLAVIDLARTHTLEGRAELALQVRDAMAEHGFFYAVNHGYTQAQNERMFDIADVPFTHVSDAEKSFYGDNIKANATYQGYKQRQVWHVNGGVYDQIEQYNINHDIMLREHPTALRPFLPEIEAFTSLCHTQVLHPILRLLALGMELPEESFVNVHNYARAGAASARFMKYFPRTDDEESKTNNVWLKGHTDFGSISILWSQPISALQILSQDGQWRWIRHIENALVVNAGDAMEFLSGGFYKGTIHRVIQPPVDQRGLERLGVFYFGFPDDDVKLMPFADSPVLQEQGVQRRFEDAEAPTMEMWRKGRATNYGLVPLHKKDERIEEEFVNGVVVNHYN
ncbi:Clavaminate synthase-like protein [Amylocystis lapponica]|nr:Clavaminate synthase-like protein [Amylocystis lapponica]